MFFFRKRSLAAQNYRHNNRIPTHSRNVLAYVRTCYNFYLHILISNTMKLIRMRALHVRVRVPMRATVHRSYIALHDFFSVEV